MYNQRGPKNALCAYSIPMVYLICFQQGNALLEDSASQKRASR